MGNNIVSVLLWGSEVGELYWEERFLIPLAKKAKGEEISG